MPNKFVFLKRFFHRFFPRSTNNQVKSIFLIVFILLWLFFLIIFFINHNKVLINIIYLIVFLTYFIIFCFFCYYSKDYAESIIGKILTVIFSIPLTVLIISLVWLLVKGICHIVSLIPFVPYFDTETSAFVLLGAPLNIFLLYSCLEWILGLINKKHYDIVHCRCCGASLFIDRKKINYTGDIICSNCSRTFSR